MGMRNKVAAGALAACIVSIAGCDLFLSADARVARAERMLAEHDYRGAMIQLKNALQTESGHIEARLLLADASLRAGDVAAAEKELRFAIEAGAPVERTAPLAAEIRLALGEARELLAVMDAGELPMPEPLASTYRGRALLELGDAQAALAAFEGALGHDAHSRAGLLGRADAYAALGRIEDALRELDAMAAQERYAAEALLARGTLYGRRGQFDEAERDLEAAQQRTSELSIRQRAALFAALTEARLARGDLEAARAAHQELAQLAANAPLARLLAARIAAAEQDYSTAASELQRAVSAVPDFVAARFFLGAVLLAQGNLHQAEQHLLQVLQRAPENLEARKLLAQVQLRLERPDAAMQVLLPAAQDGDGQLDALLGLAHLKLGDRTKGLEFLERSVADHPHERGPKLELAAARLANGAHREAIELLRTVEHVPDDLRAEQLLIAAVAAGQGVGAARTETERLLARHPRETGMLNLAASFFASQRDFEGARALLHRAHTEAPRDITTLLNRGRIEVAAGNDQAGAGWLERALEVEPNDVAAHVMLAELAMRRSDPAAALRWLEQARERNAEALEPRLHLARLHLRERRNADADGVIKELLASHGTRANVLNSVGLLYLEAGRYAEALARFRAATDADSRNAAYWLNVARVQLALGHRSVAREALQKSVALRPDWVAPAGALALLDLREGRREAALARVAALEKALPGVAAVMLLEGDVYMGLERYADAAAAFDRALQREPSAAAALKSYRARQLGKLRDAVVPLESWVRRQPADFATRTVLADAYRLAGQRARAIEQYEVILASGPANAGILNNLAWLYQEVGDERAEATAKHAYEQAPEVAAVADTYGWILLQAGKPAEGLDVLRKAATAAQTEPDIRYHYAVALAETGAVSEARKLLESVLEGTAPFPSRADAERLLQRLPRS